MAPVDATWLFSVLNTVFACHFVANLLPPPSHPIGVLVVLAMPVKKVSKKVGNHLAIHSIVCE